MKLTLKGIHKVTRKLAGGSTVTHFYAWRGGPKITAAPGSAEFVNQWQELTAARDTKPTRHAGTFQTLITAYQSTPAFATLGEKTRTDYLRYIRRIETAFGDLPIAALNDPAVRGVFLDWRDKIATTAPRTADYGFAVLARIVAWAYDRRKILSNPCERAGRTSHGTRAAQIWSDDDVAAFTAFAPAHVILPLLIALWTGQRQGDILRLTWAAYDGATIRLRQSKRGKHLSIPVAAELRRALDAARTHRSQAVTICTTSRGTPWTTDGFKSSFGKAQAGAGIAGLTFHDLRGTAVARLAAAGCTVPEIAQITGHALKDCETILDRHYFSRDKGLGESAMAKLEKHQSRTPSVNGHVNGPIRPAKISAKSLI